MPPRPWLAVVALVAGLGCVDADTSQLPAEREAELVRDTVKFREANLTFRYTHDAGRRDAGWEDRVASIVVTSATVLIHKNEKVGLEITPASRRFYEVHRDGDRVRINAGSGGARETWSFVPTQDSDGWTLAIRAVIRRSRSVANQE